MAINNITQTISTLPPAGSRGVDVQTQFVIKQEDFQDHLQGTTVNELNTLKDQLNSRIGEINSTTTTMNGYANTASASASTATTKAGEASASASDALAYKNQAETFKNNASASATKASQWADNNYNVEVETGKYSAKHWTTVAQNTVNNKIDKVTSTDNAIVRFNGTTGQVQNSSVVIDDSNRVGIGTSSPSYKLDINGGDGNSIIYRGTTNNVGMGFNTTRAYVGTVSNSSFSIDTDGSERMRIDTSGNVLLTSGTGALGYGAGAGGVVTQLTSKSTAITLNKPSGMIITSDSALAAGAIAEFQFNNSLISSSDMLVASLNTSTYNVFTSVGYNGFCFIRVINNSGSSASSALSIHFELIKGATA